MWPIWFRSEISSGKKFEILWKFVIFQIFISTVLSNLHSTDVISHCTDVIPPLYWRYPPLHWIPSTVLMLSPTVLMLSPACTDVIPPMYWCYPPLYWCYPPLYWTTSTVLKVSPTCTAVIPYSTEGIPPQYWCYPSTVLMLSPHSTDVIPPHVLMLSPRMYWCYPPLYWTTSTVLKLSPTVLNNLHSTEAIPPQYWCYPPDVLNNLQCTEQPPQYWTEVIWGGFMASWHWVVSFKFTKMPLKFNWFESEAWFQRRKVPPIVFGS